VWGPKPTNALFVALVLSSLLLGNYLTRPLKLYSIGDSPLKVELAKTETQKTLGLGKREQLPKNHGMLFIYTRADYYQFWMKDTLMPLDIVWLDSQKRIINITANVSPTSYPQTFTPDQPAQYVLEVGAGRAAEAGLLPGDRISW
jgi:uncharacterized protein